MYRGTTDRLTGYVNQREVLRKALHDASVREMPLSAFRHELPVLEEGLLVGISSGATLAAISQKLPDLGSGTRVLGFNYDTGERYLSVPDFLPNES